MDSDDNKEEAKKSHDQTKEVEKKQDSEPDGETEPPIILNSSQILTKRKDTPTDRIQKTIGKEGGTIEVGGCKVVVPPGALNEEVKIELLCSYERETETTFDLTPVLVCCPVGQKFRKKVEITLPVLIKIDTKDFWEVAIREAVLEKKSLKIIAKEWLTPTTNSFTFSTLQFSMYNAVLTGITEKPSKIEGKRATGESKIAKLLHVHQDVSREVNPGLIVFEKLMTQLPMNNIELQTILPGFSKITSDVISKKVIETGEPDKICEEIKRDENNVKDDVPEITEQELIDDFEYFWPTKKTIGEDGGTIQVGGCEIDIPPDALEEDVEIEVAAFYGWKNKSEIHLTPLLQCKPHGQEFKKMIKITLPTCYSAEGKDRFMIRMLKTWKHYDVIRRGYMTMETKSFQFTVDHFSIFDVVPLRVQQFLGWRKEKALIFAVTPDSCPVPENIDAHVLLCDNNEAVQRLDGLKQVLWTSFLVLYGDQNLSLKVTSQGINIHPAVGKKVDKIWEKTRVEVPFSLTSQNELLNKDIKITVKSDHEQTMHEEDLRITAFHLAPPPAIQYTIDAPNAENVYVGSTISNDPPDHIPENN